jgi:2-dehydro-3-deoxyphosphogluconate aldolase/(4S)-4-hydroxy-2-oxoglutarate aldolase
MAEVEALEGCRVIIDLPDAHLDDLVAAGEVLVQEGLSVWTVPPIRSADLAKLRRTFGGRVRLGVHGLRTPDEVAQAAALAPDLLLTPFGDPAFLAAAGAVPIILGGLTPNEIERALSLKPAGVQVIPCDALGTLYARGLPGMFADAPLVAAGKLERFQCEMWLQAGAAAVSPLGTVSAEAVEEPDLTDLRHRCRALMQAIG